MLIETDRLIIRSLRETDIPDYAVIVSDSEVTRYLRDSSRHSNEQAARYTNDCIKSEAREGFARYAVTLKDTGELI
jgi:RimJ/RimL family protein N-acetyltransferase